MRGDEDGLTSLLILVGGLYLAYAEIYLYRLMVLAQL
jgi:hypothetical protein